MTQFTSYKSQLMPTNGSVNPQANLLECVDFVVCLLIEPNASKCSSHEGLMDKAVPIGAFVM